MFLAGVWLIAAPPALDFGAAQHAFRPYWVPMILAAVLMPAGLLRAVAPLDVPWLRAITIALAVLLVAAPFVHRTDAATAVVTSQVLAGAAVALGSLVVAISTDDWLG